MKKRKNIIISAITCMMSICLMMFGVYAASNPSLGISGQVSYSARDAKVLVLGKVNGQAGDDSNIDYPAVADATNPTESTVSLPAQYLGYTKGESVNDPDDNLPKWDMGTTPHAFYEDSTGIRPITISFMLRNLSNYPVVATVDFTGVTDANLASKNLTRETTGMTDDNKLYLDKGRAKEISITYAVANDAVGVNGDGLLNMSITFEKTVFPETIKGEVQIDGKTINQSDWKYSFDGDSFTIVKFVGNFPEKVDGESTLEIPSQVKCEDGTVYPINTIGTMTEYDFMKAVAAENEEGIYAGLVILDFEKAQTDETYIDKAPSNVVIPEGIETIGAVAFLETAGLKDLPNSVKEIGSYSCVGTAIATLNLPNLTKVGTYAFMGSLLSRVYIEQEAPIKISVGEAAFGDNSALQIYVPSEDYKTATNWSAYESVMKVGVVIGDWLVKLINDNLTCDIVKYIGDTKKETLTIPATFTYKNKTYNVVAVGSENEEDSSVFYGDISLRYIGLVLLLTDARTAKGIEDVFKNSEGFEKYNITVPYFKSVVIENGIQKLNQRLFAACMDLKQISIPQSVTSLGDGIFTVCWSLQSITLPDQITTISAGCFATCPNLKYVKLPSSLSEISDSAFSECTSLETITIPDGVTKIGKKAFENCENLTTITLPSNLQTIGNQAFDDCYRLAEVINLSNLDLDHIRVNGSEVNTYIKTHAVRIATSGTSQITTVGDFKFVQGDDGSNYLIGYFGNEKDISLPTAGGRYKIKEYAFANMKSLESVVISNNVTEIGTYAFRNCNRMYTITIPSSVSTLGYNCFWNCGRLAEVINLSNANLNSSYAQSYAVRIATSGTSQIQTENDFKFIVGDDGNKYLVGYYGDRSFYKGEISLPQTSSNYRIKSYSFYNVDMPSTLEIPNCVDYIGDYAFESHKEDYSVIVPDSVTHIGTNAFSYSDGIDLRGVKELVLGTGVTEVGALACAKLTIKATVPPKFLTDYCFDLVNGTPSAIYVPAESVEAYKNADGWKNYADIIQAIA